MSSYALAFGILGGGVVLAAILWSIPHLRRRAAVRRFRKALAHVDVVAMSWSQGLRHQQSDDLSTTPPEGRRTRRRRNEPEDGGASLV